MSGKSNHKELAAAAKAAIDTVNTSEYVIGLSAAAAIIKVSRQQVRNLIAAGDLKNHGSNGHYARTRFLRSDCERLVNLDNRAKAGRKYGWRKVKE